MLQELADAEARAQQGLASIPESSKISAYQAWLGFYNSFKSKLRWTPAELVQQANYFSQTIGQSSSSPLHFAALTSRAHFIAFPEFATAMSGFAIVIPGMSFQLVHVCCAFDGLVLTVAEVQLILR